MNKPSHCQSCVLADASSGFSLPHGAGTSGVVIIGDSLSHADYQEGKVFTQDSGKGGKLAGTIRLAGAVPGQFHYTSLLSCFPPHGGLLVNMPYEAAATAHCAKHWQGALRAFQTPHKRTLLVLGEVGLRTVFGYSGRDKDKQGMKYLRGYPVDTAWGPAIPSYPPWELLEGKQHLTPYLELDIRKAMAIAAGRWDYATEAQQTKKRYLLYPTIADAEWYLQFLKDNLNLKITYDIETAQASELEEDERGKGKIHVAEITQIQFSHKKGFGIVFPWKYPFINIALAIMVLPHVKAGVNCYNFDNMVLRDKGVQINGTIHDLMWMFKMWQPKLHRNLQAIASMCNFPFAWKHLFESETEFYCCADVDAPQWILADLPKKLKDSGCWDVYQRHLRQYYEVALKPASDMGIFVNRELHVWLDKSLERRMETLMEEMQKSVPQEIIPITLTPKEGYKKVPKVLYELADAWNAAVEAKAKVKYASFEEAAKARLGLVQKDGKWFKENYGKFSPNSSQQVKKYLRYMKDRLEKEGNHAEAKLYTIPTVVKKGQEKETTGKDELAQIADKTQDPILTNALEARSIGKLRTNDLPNWWPSADGAVHTEWHFGPPTGQMGSRSPNVLNASKHTEVGQLFRRIIEAPKGYTFVEFDKRSFHVAMMGFVAKDKTYIRFSQLDPHSIFTSWIIPSGFVPKVDLEGMEDGEILDICKRIKKHEEYGVLRQKVAKPCVLGNQLGLGSMRLYRQNRQHITSLAWAKRLQAQLGAGFPIVEKYKIDVREKAHRQTFLQNYYGRIQRFYEVYRWSYSKKDRKWVKGFGSESDKAIGFEVQSNAFDNLIEEVMVMHEMDLLKRFNFANTIHDSLIFMPRVEELEECIRLVGQVMIQPSKVLVNSASPEGLVVGVEWAAGRNWAKWHEEKNPEGMKEGGII